MNSTALFCQVQTNNSLPQKNSTIVDSLLNEASLNIISNLSKSDIKKSYLSVSEHPAKDLLKNLLIKNSSGLGVTFLEGIPNISTDNSIEILIKETGVEYFETENDSIFTRIIIVDIFTSVRSVEGILSSIPETKYIYTDTIPSMSKYHIENSSANYTKAELPKKEMSFFEEILEPAIVIVTAAATVILLFTVRSE